MSAMYRILEQEWTKEDALGELVNGDYGFHSIWSNIPRYLRKVNVEELRAKISALKPRDEAAPTHAVARTTRAARTRQAPLR
jgi:hypothetical protein